MTKPGANTIEARALPFLQRIENLFDDIASERGAFMARAKSIRADMKLVYEEAAEADVPKKALRQLVKYRELERKQEALADEMEGEDGAYDYEMLVAALGQLSDLPLGRAALDQAAGEDGEEEDVRPRFKQTDGEAPAPKGKGRGKKPTATVPAESDEEREALGDIDKAGSIGGAAASFQVN